MKIKAEILGSIDLEGKVEEVIEHIQDYKKRYEESGWTDIEIEYDYYGYDGGKDITLVGMRDETLAEEKKRLEKERKIKEREAEAKAKKLKKERKEYVRLKKKFEGK